MTGEPTRPDVLLLCDRQSGYEAATGTLLGGPVDDVFRLILQAPGVELDRDRFDVLAAVERTNGHRKSRQREYAEARPRVSEWIRTNRPAAVIVFGNAAVALFDANEAVPMGEWLSWENTPVFVTLHPREALWSLASDTRFSGGASGKKRTMYEHWKAIAARLR